MEHDINIAKAREDRVCAGLAIWCAQAAHIPTTTR